MGAEADSARRSPPGFVFGELLIAALLLVVAVSSMAALMYSVSHRADGRDANTCIEAQRGRSAKCVQAESSAGGARMLRADCEKGNPISRKCADTAEGASDSAKVIVRSRTDSAALAVAARKQKAAREAARTDRGFVR